MIGKPTPRYRSKEEHQLIGPTETLTYRQGICRAEANQQLAVCIALKRAFSSAEVQFLFCPIGMIHIDDRPISILPKALSPLDADIEIQGIG